MEDLTLDTLLRASRPGGPTALGSVGQLRPAAGEHALVAPAKYTDSAGAVYVYEDRFIEGAFREVVLLDSRSSTANRMEDAIALAIEDGDELLARMPHITVSYTDKEGQIHRYRDYTLPHRAFDAHVRLGTVDGKPVSQVPEFRAARDASPHDAWPLFALSPVTVLLGGWDSSRRTNQARFPSAITGEIIGVIEAEGRTAQAAQRSGARLDPVGASVRLDSAVAVELAEGQADEISPKLLQKISKQKGTVSASNLGLGAIPPGTEALDGIAVATAIRSYSLSFSTLRRLRFGKGAEGDAAIRALLAALGLVAMVRNDAETFLRANCHLVESAPTQMVLDKRQGNLAAVKPPTIAEADALLQAAYDHAAQAAGIDWRGQSFDVIGNPAVIAGAEAKDAGEE